ncbi:type II 3-dehydroquinate dehydratase [Psychrobacter sp. I-STPA10]|uniref:type II 3-dehydroquinate dehydratase n=1 Tax=Psychrobacter sp. I-STPA10 TaxID=2585769 RepID=UPI001E5076E9|nr:type II 3-dehydroquinate dehydratase [Psychrobacter sp. I-STPA10]
MTAVLSENQQTSTLNKRVLLLNGPNLNLLGKREPEIYGYDTLTDIENRLKKQAQQHDITLICHQSNHEGELVDIIHQYGLLKPKAEQVQAIIINPAAFTHTSVALRDALLAVCVPFIEVHLSNVHKREPFRHHSYFSDCAIGVICGLGAQGYEMALQYIIAQQR